MSLTLRLTLTYLLVTLGGLLLLGAGAVTLAGSYTSQQRERALGSQADLYAIYLSELVANADALRALAPDLATRATLPTGVQPRIFARNGERLAGDPALGPFPSRAAQALVTSSLPLPASQVSGRRYVARAIAGPAGSIGIVELSQSTEDEQALQHDLLLTVGQAAAGAALVMALVSLLVARSIAQPIAHLQTLAEALAGGSLDLRATPLLRTRRSHHHRDEIGQLAASLDHMADQLQRRIAESEGQRTRLTALEQARTRFVRSISHELRTPLTAIRGTLENLQDDARPDQQAALATLEAEAARLARLVDELLRPPADGALLPAERQLVDLGTLARELCALQQGRAHRAGIALHCEVAASVPLVLGDRDRLKQALLNLLDNALKATPPGGTVWVNVEQESIGWVRVMVEDTGQGVPPELRGRIWERGVSGPELGLAASGGTGLGLSLVREIVTASGGQAWAEGREPIGARFVLELPAKG